MLCALPVETAARELDGMLYLALHLAARGLPSLLGERMVGRIVKQAARPVLYFDSDQHVPTNSRILQAGGLVFNLNPEGQGIADNSPRYQKNFARIAEHVSTMLTFGQVQADILRGHIPEALHHVLKVTGHPSFDLATPAFLPYYASEDIRRAHGDDYILVNTSFAFFNHVMGFENYVAMLARMPEWSVYATPEHQELLHAKRAHQEQVALGLVEVIGRLARAGRRVVLRPHPGEGTAFYKEHLSGVDGVAIDKSGSARQWIATAGAVIHHDCTTGMEAMLLGKPVIQYGDPGAPGLTARLMADVGRPARSPEDVLHALDEGLRAEDVERFRQGIGPHLANLHQNASRTIAALAEELGQGSETWLPERLGPCGRLKVWRKHVSRVLRSKQPGRKGREARYALAKFPRLYRDEVLKRLVALRAIEPELPPVAVDELCMDTFLIRPLD